MAKCSANCRNNPKELTFFEKYCSLELDDSDDPELFGRPQCCSREYDDGMMMVYLVYRVVAALFFTGSLLYFMIEATAPRTLIYLTRWSFFLITINTILQVACVAYCFRRPQCRPTVQPSNSVTEQPSCSVTTVSDSTASAKPVKKKTPLLFKINWVVNNIVLDSAPLVTCGYWLLATFYGVAYVGFVSIVLHAVNSIYVVLDMMVSGFPVRLLHCYHGMLFGVVYILFTAIYWGAGGTDIYDNPWIYPVLDYGERPGQAAGWAILVVLVGVPIVHTFMYGLYRLRLRLYSSCVKSISMDDDAVSLEGTETVHL